MAGTLVIDTLNASTGPLSTNNGMSGIAKAWCLYNASTQTVTNSFNISSVTYVATGNYRFNFATAMPDASYCALGTSCGVAGTYFASVLAPSASTSFSTTSATMSVTTWNTSGLATSFDPGIVCFAIHR